LVHGCEQTQLFEPGTTQIVFAAKFNRSLERCSSLQQCLFPVYFLLSRHSTLHNLFKTRGDIMSANFNLQNDLGEDNLVSCTHNQTQLSDQALNFRGTKRSSVDAEEERDTKQPKTTIEETHDVLKGTVVGQLAELKVNSSLEISH
jgi:hypothetical protein